MIPLRGSKTWHDRIVNKTNVDIYEPKNKLVENGDSIGVEVQVKKEPVEEPMEVEEILPIKEVKTEIHETPKTLEEQAAQEILQDLKKGETNGDEKRVFTLPVTESSSAAGEKEVNVYLIEFRIILEAFKDVF